MAKSVMSAATLTIILPPGPAAAMSSFVALELPITAAFTLRVPPKTVRLPRML